MSVTVGVFLAVWCSVGLNLDARAQSEFVPTQTAGLQPIALDQLPQNGLFYSLAHSNSPPWPCFPPPDRGFDVQVYALGNGAFLVDDSSVAEQRQSQYGLTSPMDDPSGSGGGGANSPSYSQFTTNDLWLEILSFNDTNSSASLVMHSPTPGVFDLFFTTNIGPAAWYWIARGLPGQSNFTEVNLPATTGFFIAANTNGLDANGLTTAYRGLVGGTNTLSEDLYGSGMPDAWQIENFGDLSQSPNGDYDGDGTDNLQEYLDGTDPNKINFSVAPATQYVNSTPVPLQITVANGVPAGMAVLVDSTNFATASWTNYSSNPAVDLGAAQGWHQVWVGLRGRMATSAQTWAGTRVKLDQTPPMLVITNPASRLLWVPVIQLQGYCPESLVGLTYDLTNAVGLVTNRPVFVLGQFYDTNVYDFTTNYFQAFDVPLTNGANTITLHATDLAGNTTATNFTFTLDYSSKTNPPTLTLAWPQNGTRVGDSLFTCRGSVSDPTAQVTAQVVGGGGATNVVTGRVGRDGNFWVEDVPLAAGTNLLSLAVTDAVGNVCSTNITVVQSEATLTIEYAGLPSEEAGGLVSDPTASVWVNGVQATNFGDGSWEAWPLQLTLDTTTVQARAIPNSDNGGMGEGGGACSSQGNPCSNQGTDAEIDLEWPAGQIHLKSVYDSEYDEDMGTTSLYVFDWQEQTGGNGKNTAYFPGDPSDSWDNEWILPGGRWPLLANGIMFSPPYYNVTNVAYPPWETVLNYAAHHQWDYSYPGGNSIEQYHDQDQPVIVTGGKPGSTGITLYGILATGTAGGGPLPTGYASIPPQRIYVDNFGNLDMNGFALAAMPDHSELDVKTTVPGTNDYIIAESAASYTPVISFNGQPVTGSTVTVFVGQLISLTCRLLAPAGFPSVSITNCQWTIPGFAISNYVPSMTSSMVYSNFPTDNSNVFFYWADGGTNQVQCVVTVLGQQLTPARATFNVMKPEATWTLTPMDQVAVDTNFAGNSYGYYYLRTGKNYSTNDVGMLYQYQAVDLKGYSGSYQFQFVQIATLDWRINLALDFPTTNLFSEYILATGVDAPFGNYFYERWFVQSGQSEDTPADKLTLSTAFDWRRDNFECYLMFKPDGGIPVPIKLATWNWYGRAQQVGTNSPPRFVGVPPFTSPQPGVGVNCSVFPHWTNNCAAEETNWTYQTFWYPTP